MKAAVKIKSGKSGSRESEQSCGLAAGGKSGRSQEKVGNPSQSLTIASDPCQRRGARSRRPTVAADRTPELAPTSVPLTPRKAQSTQPLHAAGAGWPAMVAHEEAVIAAAVAILDARLRVPGKVFDTPSTLKRYFQLQLACRAREAFGVLFLDAALRALSFEVMFEGTLTQATVYPREVVRRALEWNAAAVVLTHNHPSANAEPSRADENLTLALKSALALVEVRVLDHVVVSRGDVISFAERGMM